ncbi:MAG: SCO family protein [bacterium]|nr:SCO family protein [bacterium]
MIRRLLLVALVASLSFGCIKNKREGEESGTKDSFGDVSLQRFEHIGGDFTLTDQNGKPWTLSEQKGKALILFFGYLTCPDVCPTTLVEMSKVLTELGRDAEQTQVVFISVDPERDSPENLRNYLVNFNPAFIGLTGTPEQIAKVAEDYKVVYRRREQRSAMGYTIDHSSGSYLVDKAGDVRYIFAFQTKPKFIVKGIEKVLGLAPGA